MTDGEKVRNLATKITDELEDVEGCIALPALEAAAASSIYLNAPDGKEEGLADLFTEHVKQFLKRILEIKPPKQ